LNSNLGDNDATQAISVVSAGARFSHYQIISKIGAGGMGDVYLAKDNILDRNVVLKFLSAALSADEEFKTRFLREAKTAASLNHPNIITIYEIEESGDRMYIAMEQVKGLSLKKFMETESPDPARILDITVQVCSGLQIAHEAGIVHRDIKPDNIMIKKGDFVKVLDFGLAKFKGKENLTRTGTTLGTVNYMSPEQGQGLELDHRSDIFSVGIVLYEMLTGKTAFGKDTIPATLYAIVHNALPPLAESMPHLPAEYQGILDKCLAKEIPKRYQNMSEMINDINSIRGHSQILQSGYQSSGAPKPKTQSMAVLCLTNLSTPEDDFLCYGISEDLIVDLTRIGNFRVAPIRSVLKYRNSTSDLTEIAEELAVNYILDGSLMKTGTTIRVSAQLVEVSSNKNLWADRWEVAPEDLPQIKTSLARGVGKALELDDEILSKSQLDSSQAGDAAAYEFYLRGKYAFDQKKDTSDVEVALGLFNQAISEEPTLLVAQLGIAKIFIHRGEFQKAIVGLESPLEKARDADRKGDLFRILLVMSEAQVHLSNWDDGRKLAEEALKLSRVRNNIAGETEALNLLIEIHQRRAEFDQALLLFERVMEITRRMDDEDMIAESLKSIANVHFRKGEYARAKTLYEEAISIARRRGNVHLDAKCICNIGLAQGITGDLDAALKSFEKALEMYKQIGDKTGLSNAYNNMALVHSSRGAYRKAMEYGQLAADLVKELKESASYALAICNVARYKAILGDYDPAIANAKEALAIANQLNYPFVVNLANDSLGYCHYCSGNFKSAHMYYQTALEVAEKSNLRRETALALSDLAKLSFYLGDLENCRNFADRAFELAREVGVPIATIRASMYIAVTTVANGDARSGINMLEKAMDDARQLGDPRFIIACMRLLSQMISKSYDDKENRDRAAQLLNDASSLAEQKEIAYEKRLCELAKSKNE